MKDVSLRVGLYLDVLLYTATNNVLFQCFSTQTDHKVDISKTAFIYYKCVNISLGIVKK